MTTLYLKAKKNKNKLVSNDFLYFYFLKHNQMIKLPLKSKFI